MALALTRLVIALSGLVANLALIELLPRETFGAYRLVWSVVVVFAFAANLGMGHLINREVARDPDRAAELVPKGWVATAFLSTATMVAICGWFALTRPGDGLVFGAAFFGALTLAFQAQSQIAQGALHGLRAMFLELPGILASRLVFVCTQVGLALAGYGLVALYAGRALAAAVLLVVLAVQLRRRVGPLTWGFPLRASVDLARAGRVFGATVFFSAISAQADIVMLGLFTHDAEVARYGAPAAVLLQLAFVANIFSRGFFPRMSALSDDRQAAATELSLLTRMLLVVSVPVAVGGILLAEPLLGLLRGGAYADAWLPFVLLLLAVPVRFLTNGLGWTLTALDRQGERARLDMAGAGLNVALNLVAIPLFGAEGAAATTLATDLLLLALLHCVSGPSSPSATGWVCCCASRWPRA